MVARGGVVDSQPVASGRRHREGAAALVPVVVIGLEHHKAPFDMLERATLTDHEVGPVLAALGAHDNVREVAVVSTCLRTEIYAVVDRFHDAVDDVTELLATRSGHDRQSVEEHQSVYFDRGVATHLFRVAAGLESAVPGETEVLGQVRRSLDRAVDEGSAGPMLSTLFRHAVQTGRRVRSETSISRGTTSFSYAAVELAEAHLRDQLDGAVVVVLGAGALGSGTVMALVDERRDQRPSEVIVVNRTIGNAEQLIAGLEASVPLRAVGIHELADVLAKARLLICAAEAETPLVGLAEVAGRDAELLVVDLGMPRTVEAAVGELAGIDLLDISHLRSVVEQAMDERRNEVVAAESIVAEEVDRYLDAQRGRGAAPVVVALRERLEEIRAAELSRRGGELAGLSDEQRRSVEALTRSMLAKLVHEPTVALKESAGTPRGERLVEAARLLFDL